MRMADMPFYHRAGAKNGNTYVRFGNVRKGGNESYCYAQEKQCAGRICRILAPEKAIFKATVIRDDGTAWEVLFENYESWERIEIIEE